MSLNLPRSPSVACIDCVLAAVVVASAAVAALAEGAMAARWRACEAGCGRARRAAARVCSTSKRSASSSFCSAAAGNGSIVGKFSVVTGTTDDDDEPRIWLIEVHGRVPLGALEAADAVGEQAEQPADFFSEPVFVLDHVVRS